MKAWIVDCGDEWVTLVHAATAGKAKYIVKEQFAVEDFTYLKAKRLSGCDDRPFTHQNAKDAGFQYVDVVGGNFKVDDDGYIRPEEFVNDCYCDICRGVLP